MNSRISLQSGVGIALVCWSVGMAGSVAVGQTPLQGGFEMTLQPGYAHEPLQGIDSIVGKVAKKGGLQIQYEMGAIPAPGALRLGGHFVNQALQMPEKDRLWLKEQVVGARKVNIAYSKKNQLVISSESATEGVNFHTQAKTPADIADVLLMVLTLQEETPKSEK